MATLTARGEGIEINIDWSEQLMRTLLFVPGIDERKLAKVGTLRRRPDLHRPRGRGGRFGEDGRARGHPRRDPDLRRPTVVTVRVNALDTGRLEDDIAAVVCPDLDGDPRAQDRGHRHAADRRRGAGARREGQRHGDRLRAHPRDHGDAARDRALRGHPALGARSHRHRDLRPGRLLGGARRGRHARGHGAALRPQPRDRGHPGRGHGAAARRPVPRGRGPRRLPGEQPPLARRSASRAAWRSTRRRWARCTRRSRT